jgi:hypothetical protein
MKRFFNCLMLQLFCALNINAQLPMPRDLVVNEILFNPVKDGFDYVEIYNRINHNISLNELLIANRNSVNEIASVKYLSKDPLTIMPGAFIVLTGNMNWLKQRFIVPDTVKIIQLSLPSFADDEGCVVLLRRSDSLIIDELAYDESWHFKMITDPQGIALEKINFDLPSQDSNNWTSASSSAGYGTPGYVNSQFRSNGKDTEVISVFPDVFTPNNDGENDFASITINTRAPGKIINAVIFNTLGKRVRYLLKNQNLGAANRFTWNGYNDNDELLPSGIYIIFTQIFDTKGSVTKYRNCIVLNSFPP